MKRSMLIMGFTLSDIHCVLKVVSALLHLSNLTFIKREDCCALDKSNVRLMLFVRLLGITAGKLNSALCYHEITAAGETHQCILSYAQAEKGVEALIKATYAALFNYLVKSINLSIANVGGNHD